MILCDRSIEEGILSRRIIVDPLPDPDQYNSTSLDLRVGDDFYSWNRALKAAATRHQIDLETIDLADIFELADPLPVTNDGIVVIEPGAFVLVRTLELINLPLKSKIAARVEGRSKQARLGMTAHITAPTVHAGFRGKIVLEIVNHGPFYLEVQPNVSRLCQLIFEQVDAKPSRGGSAAFSEQQTPLGTPKQRRER